MCDNYANRPEELPNSIFKRADAAVLRGTCIVLAGLGLLTAAITVLSAQPALPQKGVRPLATKDDSDTKHNGEGVRPRFEYFANLEPVEPKSSPPAVVQERQTFEKHVRPFFTEHCLKCHGADKAEAKLRLDTLSADFLSRPASDHWVEVLNRINLGEMPPKDEPKVAAVDLERITDWITSELDLARQHSQSTGGRVVLRRLTRFEYANTVRSLLQVDFVAGESPLEKLPPDGSIAGFDRISKALLLDPSLMESYLNVAQDVGDRAVAFRPPLVPEQTLHYDFADAPRDPNGLSVEQPGRGTGRPDAGGDGRDGTDL